MTTSHRRVVPRRADGMTADRYRELLAAPTAMIVVITATPDGGQVARGWTTPAAYATNVAAELTAQFGDPTDAIAPPGAGAAMRDAGHATGTVYIHPDHDAPAPP